LTTDKTVAILSTVAYGATIQQEGVDGMKANELKGKIVARGMNVEALADAIGIDRSSLYRKLNNFEKITIGEAIRIKDALCLTNAEAYEIFLA
jgi:transcriptional regulator of acetoin/glycerol metabolism